MFLNQSSKLNQIMFDNSKYKNDLKIVVDNSNKQEDEILIIESGGDDNMDHHNNEQDTNNTVQPIEIDSEIDETEFHVNLDKVPLTLKNTILGSKVYLNDSYEKEKIDDLVRRRIFFSYSSLIDYYCFRNK